MHAVVPDVLSSTLTVKAPAGSTSITIKDNVADKWKVCFFTLKVLLIKFIMTQIFMVAISKIFNSSPFKF